MQEATLNGGMKYLFDNNRSAANDTGPTGKPYRLNQTEVVIKVVFFWLIIIVGIVGNSLVITVVRMFRSMRTTTNYLLVNVACADITTLVFTAVLFIIMQRRGPVYSRALASFLCKLIYTNTISIIALLVTGLTLTVLALERYNALVKPMLISRRLTINRIANVIIGIWFVAITMMIPLFATLDYDPSTRSCSHGDAEFGMMIYIDCLIVILTLVPFLVITFCYTQIIYGMYFKKAACRSKIERGHVQEETKVKRRLVTLLILLTVVFFIAFIPYGVLLILKVSKVNHIYVLHLQSGSQYLTLLNCAVNPLIYAFQSSSYRRAFMLIIKKMLCRDVTRELSELLEMRTRTPIRSV